jgi:GntR family transcriptional regulator
MSRSTLPPFPGVIPFRPATRDQTMTGKTRTTPPQGTVAPTQSAQAEAPRDDFGPVSKPLYQQVKEHLIRRVLQGEWKPGECLPSEMKLAEAYGLSQGTVRKAIEELAQDGLVSRHAGRGTFVTSHKGDYKPFRFHRIQSEMGQRLTETRMDYISCTTGPASTRASKALQIPLNADVTEVVRIRTLDDAPVLLERLVIGSVLCPGFKRIADAEQPNSIYLALEQHYNLLIVRVDERIRARMANPDEVRLLNLEPGTPVLEVERIAFSLGDEPVEWRLSSCETSQVHYWNSTGG